MRSKYLVLVALTVHMAMTRAGATTLPSLPVADLLKAADVAAVVEITRGEMVRVKDRDCGAKYVGRVLERIKGLDASVGEITFGPYSGRSLGKKYLVFLSHRTRRYDPVTSTNSWQADADAKWEAECGNAVPEYREMHTGMATLEVSWTVKFNYKEAVKFIPEYVKWPEGLEAKLVEPGDNRVSSKQYWLRLDDILRALAEPTKAK